MKNFFILLFIGWSTMPAFSTAFAEEPDASAEDKATQLHKLASSDVIYQQEETKALYYQNQQIIGLLKEIRELLATRLEEKKSE